MIGRIFFIFLFLSASGFATEIEVVQEHVGGEYEKLQVTGDSIKWEVFAETLAKEECVVKDRLSNCLIKPTYSESVKALDGKEVVLTGFMFPLEPTEKQRVFLIGPYPASCPFYYHVDPSEVVEVILKEPIEFSYDPVTVKGVLSLEFNEETGVFYYLKD